MKRCKKLNLFSVGFSSHIPEDARVVVIPLHGKTSRSIVVATTGGAVVVNVGKGETCVYDQFGHSLLLKKTVRISPVAIFLLMKAIYM